VEHLEEIDASNNTGKENLHIGYSSSPIEVCFIVWIPINDPTPVYFGLR
jgi:hypothetical protein